jgi:hypothetical protein
MAVMAAILLEAGPGVEAGGAGDDVVGASAGAAGGLGLQVLKALDLLLLVAMGLCVLPVRGVLALLRYLGLLLLLAKLAWRCSRSTGQ